MPERVPCAICDRGFPLHFSYIVRIDVFADPSMPAMTSEQIAEMDFDAELEHLLDEMKDLSADDLLDQVHRNFEYRICRPCQIRFLANPLGKPRQRTPASN